MQHNNLWARIRSRMRALGIHGEASSQPGWRSMLPQPINLAAASCGSRQARLGAPRVLLLTSELGSGHLRAAQALRVALLECAPEARITIVDWWSLMNPDVARAAQKMYLDLVQNHAELYERIYPIGEHAWREMRSGRRPTSAASQVFEAIDTLRRSELAGAPGGPHASDRALFSLFFIPPAGGTVLTGTLARLALIKWSWARLVRRMETLLKTLQPDVIVSTQMIPAALISAVKQRGGLPTPSVAVPTDFGVHDFWIQPGTDLYCVGHESLMDASTDKKSLDTSTVRVTGIPLMPEFERPIAALEARRRLGLQQRVPVILVLGGGLGLGVETLAEHLLQANIPVQWLVLAGHNAEARAKLAVLAAKHPTALRVYEWTERMDVFMRAADIVVGKPGGLTVAEILACGRPFFTARSLGGQEGCNMRFLERHRVGRLLSESELVEELKSLLEHPFELLTLQARAWHLGRRNSARHIAESAFRLIADRRIGNRETNTLPPTLAGAAVTDR